ncbi:MAG: diguanylate cyclase [Lachnospiraceae bacterium]|nr:diguanylate cyclase [Lachnospiraceae bacterium]
MKKIAIFLDNAANHAIYSRICGLYKRVYEENLDIAIYLYRSRAGWRFDEKYNIGEYNIFRLPDLDVFDGFVLIFNDLSEKQRNFVGWDACHEVARRVLETGKPAISIGTRIEGIHHVGIDNNASMSVIMRHLLEVHHCRSFWFLMGPEEHRECQERAKAISDYLAGWDNRDYSDFFYYESFNPLCGEHGFRHFYEKYGTLPDAIVCANDHIAIGACTEAARQGLSAPRDFLITGFDNINLAACHTPSLTTIDQRWPELGSVCIDYLQAAWAGEEFPKSTIVYTQMIRRQSCGCETAAPEEAAEIFNACIRQDMQHESFNRQLIRFENNLLVCESIQEIGKTFAPMLPHLGSDLLYLVLDRRFYSEREQTELLRDGSYAQEPGDSVFLKEGYPPEMQVAFVIDSTGVTAVDQSTDYMRRQYQALATPKDCIFLPVHFGDRSVGYIVINRAEQMIRDGYGVRAVQMLLGAIENLYIRNRLRGANDLLARASITDAMTGVYNRTGYQEVALPYYDRHHDEGRDLTIFFADMDGMKQINDQFGHESGDFAILSIVQALRRACPQDSIMARMGGDEFLVMMEVSDDQKVHEIIDNVRREVPLTEEANRLPYAPTVSIGYVITQMHSLLTLDDYIRIADERMYEEKAAHKQHHRQGER